MNIQNTEEDEIEGENRDRLYIANQIRSLFRKQHDQSILDIFMKIVSTPLTFLRDYTTPIPDDDSWDRQRAATVPCLYMLAAFYLNNAMNTDEDPDSPQHENTYLVLGLISIIPGAILGLCIRQMTKTSAAPKSLITLFAFLAFIQGINWIGFACNVVLDLLKLFGLVTRLPTALLALTFIAWGNELGDMSADVAMTKRGFGEMAVTATIAGPVFNIAIGAGLSLLVANFKFGHPINFSMHPVINGVPTFDPVAVLPFTLMIGQLFAMVLVLINAFSNKF